MKRLRQGQFLSSLKRKFVDQRDNLGLSNYASSYRNRVVLKLIPQLPNKNSNGTDFRVERTMGIAGFFTYFSKKR